MSYRYMRILVMFDLPTETSLQRRNYRRFRKFLINEGFVMMQESIYSKICLNMHAVHQVELELKKNKPPLGLVQFITVTERQFTGMKLLVGEVNNTYLETDERMVVL